jgi:thiamine monophosphate kinase
MKNFVPKSEDLQQLEMVSAGLTTASNQTLLFCSCYRQPDVDLSWIDKFNSFLNQACDLYKNVVVSGNFSLSNISRDAIGNITGANELAFVELLNGHLLS